MEHATTTKSSHKANGMLRTSMAATQPRTEEVAVTPAQAQRWLEQNTPTNRKVSDVTVQAYAEEMKAGRWQLTHQGIAFNRTGELVDGQHRLWGIVISGVTVRMMVTTGLPLEYNAPIDQGYNRTASHILGRSSRWVSVVRGLLLLEQGMPTSTFKYGVGAIEACGARHAKALEELLAVCSHRSCPTGVVAMLAYAYPIDPERVVAFAREVSAGEMLAAGDPAFALRRWISQGRHSVRECACATASAMRARLQGRRLTRVGSGVYASERDSTSNYVWLTQRRRALRIVEGTPNTTIVPSP